ncbi:MAG: addiction module protein [Planctomycetia bacterium]|nr:addiction module protein [Planctomycetia bacterium]
MLPQIPELDIERLSVAQRLELIGKLWDSIPESDTSTMPEWHRQVLDQRLAEADAAPEKAIPWEEVKARLRRPS